MFRKGLSILVALVMMLSIFILIPFSVFAKEKNLAETSYTSKTQAEAVAWAKAQKGYPIGDGWCTAFSSAYIEYLTGSPMQLDGYNYANYYPSGWTPIPYSSGVIPQPGDLAVFDFTKEAWIYDEYGNVLYNAGHVGIVIDANSSEFYTMEQNVDGRFVGGPYTRYYNSSDPHLWGFVRPDFVKDTIAPTITNARVENISADSFTIKCDLSDDVGVTRVWLNIYGPGGQNGYEVTASNGVFSHTINTSNYGGSGLYTVHIYAFDAAGHQSSSAVNNINAINDTAAPIINNPRFENTNSGSFDVKCELSDDVGVTRVWLNIYGPKGTTNGYGVTASNGTFSHTIHTSDYAGAGVYVIHIYAFDAAGHETPCAVRAYAYDGSVAKTDYNHHQYELFDAKMTWKHAKEICESRGGHLAVINSSEENEALANIASSLSNYVWIGGTDEDSEGNWHWINGDDFSYTNWYSGEPNNYAEGGGSENYMGLLGRTGQWNDAANDNPYISGFICEYDLEKILGDVDDDDEVTIIDATSIQRKLANISTATFIETASDADEDGELTIIDATTIQRWLANLPSNNNIGKPIS